MMGKSWNEQLIFMNVYILASADVEIVISGRRVTLFTISITEAP